MSYPRIQVCVKIKGGKKEKNTTVDDSEQAAVIFRRLFDRSTFLWLEETYLLCLNSANTLLGCYPLSKGGTKASILDIQVIAFLALGCKATSIILAHNHPQGTLKPSQADIDVTRNIRDRLAGIHLCLADHIIMTHENHVSMKQHGYI